MAYACGQTQTSSYRIGQFQIRFELLSRKIEQDKPSSYSFSWLSLTDSNHPLDGNGSIISSGLPYQMFVSLIGTCGMGSDPLCCEGFLPLSTDTQFISTSLFFIVGHMIRLSISLRSSYLKQSLSSFRIFSGFNKLKLWGGGCRCNFTS